MTTFYNFSGGMESAAMLVVDRERIRSTGAIVRMAGTGKQFPEMETSLAQIEAILGVTIHMVQAPKTFDQELFEPGKKGGYLMLRRGITDREYAGPTMRERRFDEAAVRGNREAGCSPKGCVRPE